MIIETYRTIHITDGVMKDRWFGFSNREMTTTTKIQPWCLFTESEEELKKKFSPTLLGGSFEIVQFVLTEDIVMSIMEKD
jgi:hypothetical protein